jgi:Ca2+-binding RTX toxin-like protein
VTIPTRPADGSRATRGNFYYDFDRNGWVLNEAARNRDDMPILILVGADDFYVDWIDGMVNSVISGSADAVTRAFLQANGKANLPSEGSWVVRPEEFRAGGAVVVFDFQYYLQPEGGANLTVAPGVDVTGIPNADQRLLVQDNFWSTYKINGQTVHQQFSERNWAAPTGQVRPGRPTADLVIRINGYAALNISGDPELVAARYAEILNTGVARPDPSADGNVYVKLTDLNNNYYAGLGLHNLADYLDFVRNHELLHSIRKEALTAQGGFASGHGGFWAGIYTTNTDHSVAASSVQVTNTALLRDTIELEVLQNRINSGRYNIPEGGPRAKREDWDALPAEIRALFPADRQNRDSINAALLNEYLDFRRSSLQSVLAGGIAQWKAQWSAANEGRPAPEPTLAQLAASGLLTNPAGTTRLPATLEEVHKADFFDLAEAAMSGLLNSFVDLDGGQLGLALGSAIGKRLSSDPFEQVLASGTLSTALGAAGEFIDKRLGGTTSTHILDKGLESFGESLLENIKGAAVGALSSFLTAELVKALNIDGIPGEVANSLGGAVVTQILNNIPRIGEAIRGADNAIVGHRGLFTDIGPSLIASAAASYLGGKLADAIYSPQSVGGQIGSAVGAAYGGWVASTILASGLNPVTFAAAIVAVAMWQVIGGLVGSVFGGTPRSGADVAWDEAKGEFTVANLYARKGGSKDSAESLASAVSDTFNAVLSAAGATLLDPLAVQSGNYGMRNKDYVYRPTATRDKNAISARFTGKDGADRLIHHGTYLGLTSMLGQMAGGDIFVKRAIAGSLALADGHADSDAAGASGDFKIQALLGDLSIGFDYGNYLKNAVVINGLIAAEPGSTFSAGWLVTLARAHELGLNKRAAIDWVGGYKIFLDEAPDGAIGGATLSPGSLSMGIELSTGERYWMATGADGKYAGYITDTIEVGSQTRIGGTAGNDTITLTHAEKALDRGKNLVDLANWPGDPANLPTGGATVDGWWNWYSAETAWATIEGPEGKPVVTMKGGQLNGSWQGGGGHTNYIDIDGSKAYEFSVYFRKEDLTTQGVAFRVRGELWGQAGIGAYAENADGGSDVRTNFIEMSAAQQAGLVEGRWYKVVGYVLPQGSANVAAGSLGGVFDTVTGDKVANAAAFRWGANRPNDLIQSGFFTRDGNEAPGTYTTHFYQPEVREVTETAVFGGADRVTSTAGLRINGVAADGYAVSVPVAATIDAGGGDDTVHGGDMGNNILGGGGDDKLYGGVLDDWLLGGDGKDELHAGAAGGAGLGGNGNYLDGGDGNDRLFGREGSDWLEGGAGIDTLEGGGGDDILTGGADGLRDDGTAGGDSLKGGHGDDQYLLRAGDGKDVADETAAGIVQGNVAVAGTDRVNARLKGLLEGLIRKNWGGERADRLAAESKSTAAAPVVAASAAGGDDAIVFGMGIELGDIRLSRTGANGADLLIQLMIPDPASTEADPEDADTIPSGTELLVRDWFTDTFKRVEWLKFADGTEIRIGDFASFVVGTQGDDVIIGTDGADFVYAGSGNDQLHLLGGGDVGIGAGGDDLVAGDNGRDMVIGGAGSDRLIGGKDADTLSGDAGADDLYGGDDADVLSGGRGDDHVVGGGGDDVFKFSRGDGRDTIFDEYSSHWAEIWNPTLQWVNGYTRNDATGEVTGPDGAVVRRNFGTAAEPDLRWVGRFDYNFEQAKLYRYDEKAANASNMPVVNAGLDTIEFGLGIDIQDIVLTRTSLASDDLVVSITRENENLASYKAASDSITIRNWFKVPGQIEAFAFYQTGLIAVGTPGTITIQDIDLPVVNIVAGTDADDGVALLAGLEGADWISGGSGHDVLAGGGGDDILAGNSGFDIARGEAGNDVIFGGSGNDILDGGQGADKLFGGEGEDSASYESSTTAVRAHLSASWANAGAAEGDEYDGVENLIGSAGADEQSGAGDVLGGDSGDNELTGGRGDDLLMGGEGDDTYHWHGKDWNDTIREGAFTVEEVIDAEGKISDSYTPTWTDTGKASLGAGNYWKLELRADNGQLVYSWDKFAPGPGAPARPAAATWDARGWQAGVGRTNGLQVTFEKFKTDKDGGSDTIEFGAGISLSQLSFERHGPNGRDDASGRDLLIRFGSGNADTMLIKDQYGSDGKLSLHGAIETLQFRDGFSVRLETLLAATAAGALREDDGKNEFFAGVEGETAETLAGLAGDDVLSGQGGNDTLLGGSGDDVIEGGSGEDTIDGGANSAATGGKAGWGDTVRYAASGAVTVDLRKVTAQSGGEAQGDTLTGIENVIGSQSGNDVIDGDDNGNRIDGLEGDNVLRGWGGDDVLTGGGGADAFDGGDGNDNLAGGDGNDTLIGGLGNDELTGGGGIDRLFGDAGTDTLTGGDGSDAALDGGAGDDRIYGGRGDDMLHGGDGADMLDGGADADTLEGAGGDDTYRFEAGFGRDVINDRTGVSKIYFDGGLDYRSIWLTQVGDHLRIGVIGTADAVTVLGFFDPSAPASVASIQTGKHSLFIGHTAVRALIDAMNGAVTDRSATPDAMPAGVAAKLDRFWHAGAQSAPTAPGAQPVLNVVEDMPAAKSGAAWGIFDHDGEALTYSVASDGAPRFGSVAIDDAATGALTYTPGADYHGDDSFTLLVVDSGGRSVRVPVRVVVESREDAPRDLGVQNGARLAIAEQAPTSDTAVDSHVAQFSASDVEGGALTWSFALENGAEVDGGGRFDITPEGLLIVADASLLDHERSGGASVRIRLRAQDDTGAATEKDFYVAVDDANENNSLEAIAPAACSEDALVGTVVATAKASDTDRWDSDFAKQRYYFLGTEGEKARTDDGRFEIDQLTGEIRTAKILDFESAKEPLTYKVVARDFAGAEGSLRSVTDFTVSITDANEGNYFTEEYSFSLNENVAANAEIGVVKALDGDADGSTFAKQRYLFLHDNVARATSFDDRYTINAETGVIRNNHMLSRESGPPSVTYTVVARDNAGGTDPNEARTKVTITVADVNEANSIADRFEFHIGENEAIGTAVNPLQPLKATDPDIEGPNARQDYAFHNNGARSQDSADGLFRIDAATGIITTLKALNHEALAAVEHEVVVRDFGTPYSEISTKVRIVVDNRNEQNVVAATTPLWLYENAEGDTSLGKIEVSDPDAPGSAFATQRFQFADPITHVETDFSPDGRFKINTATGEITSVRPLDYDQAPNSFVYWVTVRDDNGAAGGNMTYTKVTVALRNVNERPDAPALQTAAVSVAEGGVWSASFNLTDKDGGPAPALSLISNPFGLFKKTDDGKLVFASADGTAPDFETLYGLMKAQGAVQVQDTATKRAELVLTAIVGAVDAAGLPSEATTTVSVRITDVNEAATSYGFTYANAIVSERDRPGAGANMGAITIGTAQITDPDLPGLFTSTYEFATGDSRFEMVGPELRLKAGAALDFEAGPTIIYVPISGKDKAGGDTLSGHIAITIKNETDVLNGGAQDDALEGQYGVDHIFGHGGDDTIFGRDGDDDLSGGAGIDRLKGNNGLDVLRGDAGADILDGGPDNDRLYGGADGDTLYGDQGNDTLYGEGGDDMLVGGFGVDHFDGGEGIDTADYSLTDEGVATVESIVADLGTPATNSGWISGGDTYVSVENLIGSGVGDGLFGNEFANTIEGRGGNDHIDGRAGRDIIKGEAGHDQIWGGAGDDELHGGADNDILYGGAGDDDLFGGEGNDKLFAEGDNDDLDGGAGADELHGGQGIDTYFVRRGSGDDKIYEFNPGGTSRDILQFVSDTAIPIDFRELWFEAVTDAEGQHVKVSLLGSAASATIIKWIEGEQYQIEFISTKGEFVRNVNVSQLVALMKAQTTRPTTAAEHQALLNSKPEYGAAWAALWETNLKPTISTDVNAPIAVDEGGTAVVAVKLADDLTPSSSIRVTATSITGSAAIKDVKMGGMDAAGNRLIEIVTDPHSSGTATVVLSARDSGDNVSDQTVTVTLDVRGKPSTPTVDAASSAGGTSGEAGGIPIALSVDFPDKDGSEVQSIVVGGLPLAEGVTLNKGQLNTTHNIWVLTKSDLPGLALVAPAGFSRDVTLSFTAYASENGSYAASATRTLAIAVNAPPTGATFSGSVLENSLAGAVVGSVAGIDPDGDPLRYSLVDAAASPFEISAAGQLKVKTPSAFNFEAAAAHQISVLVEEDFADPAKRRSKVVTFAVPVVNVNEAIYFTGDIVKTFSESTSVGTAIAESRAQDPDAPGTPFGTPHYWFYANGAPQLVSYDGRYEIDNVTGNVRSIKALNFEDGASRTYVIAAGDNYGGPYTAAFQNLTIHLIDVNEANRFGSAPAPMAIDENAALGAVVGKVKAIDDDLSGANARQRYYFQNGAALSQESFDRRYRIDPDTGDITVATALNFETMAGEITYVVVAEDGGTPTSRATTDVKISVANVNEKNSFAGAYLFNIDENAVLGLDVGTVAASDPDINSTFGVQQYWFIDAAGAASRTSFDNRYVIDDAGKIRVNAAISYEAQPAERTYTVAARDNAGAGNETRTAVTVRVGDLNEQNVLKPLPDLSVFEKRAGETVGTVSATDPDTPNSAFAGQRYFFLSNGQQNQNSFDNRYWINAETGEIKTNYALDYETMSTPVLYTVIARDNFGASPSNAATMDVRIGVANVAETPATPDGAAAAYFDEQPSANPAAPGRSFAAYALSDPDGTTPALVFAPGGNPNGWFAISGNQVVFAAGFDFETARMQGYQIADYNGDGRQDAYMGEVKVQATDGSLSSEIKATKFYLSDVAERPNAFSAAPQTLHSEIVAGEAVHANQTVASFVLSDPDGPAPELRIVGGNANGWFTTAGGTLKFGGHNFTSAWLRANAGQFGMDAAFTSDVDNDGLKEIRVATLTLAAVDAAGLESDRISYNIYIEDKNEAAVFGGPYSFPVNENPAAYQQVGSIAAADVDGVAGALRYYFGGAQTSYYDGSLGRQVSASVDGRFVVDLLDGRVWTNGAQALDFESAQREFSYQVVVWDRAQDQHSRSSTGTFNVSLRDVNEQHVLRTAAFSVNEANTALGPFIPVPTTSGAAIDLRAAMLSDPEGRNMRWQFSNGSTVNGAWQIEQDGTLRMIGAVDYETLTTVDEERTSYDEYGYAYQETVAVGRDPARAAVTLDVQAIDDGTGAVSQAALTINVADVNEHVTTNSWASYTVFDGSAVVTRKTPTSFWVKGEVQAGSLVALGAYDPEGRALSYSLSSVATQDLSVKDGGDGDIDSGYPVLSVGANGHINFSLPAGSGGGRDSAWQGGTVTYGPGRRSHSIRYTFNVDITDSAGMKTTIPYEITFLRRGYTVPPIVFDLDGDGLELVAYDGSAMRFDMDADGIKDVTGWVGADDGLLALDRNGDGLINDGSEISFQRDADGALTDLEGLRAFDSNANGFLDAGDARFAEFRIWRDANQDGVSQAEEIVTLEQAGVVNVGLTMALTGEDPKDAVENVVYGTAAYTKSDGSQGIVGDVFLSYDPSDFTDLAAPIVLDYDGDGSGLVSLAESKAEFDMDGDGIRQRTGWIAGGDALLAIDRNGDGIIAGISEISFVGDLAGAATDLEGLAAFDSDGDRAITTRDARFAEFLLWFDHNGNGSSDAGEVLTLTQAGIATISLGGTRETQTGGSIVGNRVHARAEFTRVGGSTGTLLDAAFQYGSNPERTPQTTTATVPPAPAVSATAPAEPAVPAPAAAVPAAATAVAAVPQPSVDVASLSYRGSSGKYLIATQGGELIVRRAKMDGAADPRAGAVGPAALLAFGNRTVGMLAPLVLDLDGDGIELTRRTKSRAYYDMDDNGTRDDSGWIGRGDGFLVIDANRNGIVDSAAELSLLGLKKDARNSFEALAALDSNRNGRIDSGDARFGELRIWADRNGDGVTDAGELLSLADHRIESIALSAQAAQESVAVGRNAVIATGTFTRTDGSTGTVADAALAFKPAETLPAGLRTAGSEGGFGALLRSMRSAFDAEDTGAGEAQFTTQDLPRVVAGPDEADEGGGSALVADRRLATLIQDMAAFGVRTGEGERLGADAAANSRYDYFAA